MPLPIVSKEKILARWAEHFHCVLNMPSTISDEAINRLPQIAINEGMADPPSVLETKKAIDLLSSGKAPGADSIPSEIYKSGGHKLVEKLTGHFLRDVETKKSPTGIQRCNHHPPLQAQGQSASMRQP